MSGGVFGTSARAEYGRERVGCGVVPISWICKYERLERRR